MNMYLELQLMQLAEEYETVVLQHTEECEECAVRVYDNRGGIESGWCDDRVGIENEYSGKFRVLEIMIALAGNNER